MRSSERDRRGREVLGELFVQEIWEVRDLGGLEFYAKENETTQRIRREIWKEPRDEGKNSEKKSFHKAFLFLESFWWKTISFWKIALNCPVFFLVKYTSIWPPFQNSFGKYSVKSPPQSPLSPRLSPTIRPQITPRFRCYRTSILVCFVFLSPSIF